MPEGDTVWRAATNLNRALAGATLTRCDVRVPEFATVDLSGETVAGVVSVGKHLLMRVGEWSIHSHLKMEGSWHLYSHGSAWKRPAHQARIVLETADWVAVGFSLGVTEIVPTARESEVVGYLGPDLLGPNWDSAEAIARLSAQPSTPIFLALLDQRNLAGLGNEYVNELCFVRGMLPEREVANTDLEATVALARKLIVANRDRTERTTTGDTRAGRRSWVYGRAGKPCRRCGTRIRSGSLGATPLQQRDTYWCPKCQA